MLTRISLNLKSKKTYLELRSKKQHRSLFLSGIGLFPSIAFGGNFEGSLQSLVNGVVGRILPVIAFFYAGEAAIHWIQNKPDAKDKASRVAVGTIALLGINGVWSWLQSHVR